MFADAIAAERFRLLRDRTGLFWGFLFAPLAALVLNLVQPLFYRLVAHAQVPADLKIDVTAKLFEALDGALSPVIVLFLLIGAAAIFAGDYRWETWRLITPRNGRINLLAAKLVVFTEWAAASLMLLALVSVVSQVLTAMIFGGGLSGPASNGAFLGQFAGVFVVNWLQVVLVGAVAALIGVATRSTMGAVIAGLVVVVAQSGLAATAHETSWKTLAIPGYAAQTLKLFVRAPAELRPEAGPAGLALVMLLAWLVVLVGAGLLLFQRQDLTKE